jgi:hypothetical protein
MIWLPLCRKLCSGLVAGAVLLGASGCGEQITGVEEPAAAPSHEVAAARNTPSHGSTSYACFLSIRDRATGGYRYYHLPLTFPEGMARRGGSTSYRYRGYEQGTEYAMLANCHIPESPRAADWLTRQLLGGTVPRTRPSPSADGEASLLACSENVVCLDGIDAHVCQWRGTYPNCKPPLAGDVPPCYDGGGCGGGDPISTGGGETACEDCFPPDEEPPCVTTDSILNAAAVQNGLRLIWDQSNADAEMLSRREVGGFVVRDPLLGYTFQAFPASWSATSCSISPTPGFTPPVNAVAWVHTHPYQNGESMTGCPPDRIVVGGTLINVYTRYMNDPSGDDGVVAQRWGIPGYVLDKERITRFVGSAQSAEKYVITSRINRCAY